MNHKKAKTKINHAIRRTTIILIMLACIIMLINLAPNYIKISKLENTRLVINNNDVTNSLKTPIVENGDEHFLSLADFRNFFDEYLVEDSSSIITTSNTKTVKIQKNNNRIQVNGSEVSIKHASMTANEKTYLPIKDMSNVYGYEYNYSKENNTIIISSLNKKLVQAISSKNQSIKYRPTKISRTIEKVKRGEVITIVQDTAKDCDVEINSWYRVRTQNGNLGYIKKNNVIERKVVRDNLSTNQISGKVNLVWDYYEPGESAPKREGGIEGVNAVSPSFYQLNEDGTISKNVSKEYIEWAHFNNYKVWPTLSNVQLNNIDTMSKILSTYDSRANLIENIVKTLTENNVDGVNIDFENMYKEDKDKFSRFIIELSPRLRDIGMNICVDVTEPDGSDTWSLCYNRNVIGNAADYIVFVAYDQHNSSSKNAGSNASYSWIEMNIKKFIEQEVVSPNKIILANAFYTRLWKEEEGSISCTVVNMNDISIPSEVQKQWNDNDKQYYIEYSKDDAVYKMWIEDQESISAKMDLVNKYKLAGAGFWEKDRENNEVWHIIKNKLNTN
ncbi:MAG: hypothetical protein IKG56_01060 [Clostridia bacterium]|nr:hypothetical protein [Clostridia bacterium]